MANSQSNTNLNDLLWIVDDWVNAEGELVCYEHWKKVNDSLFEGGSETVKNGDTVFTEKLKLLKQNNDIFYVANVKHNPAPVYFKFTGLETGKAVFENPDHDFPKKISYELNDGILHAYIEGLSNKGDWKKVDFYFSRKR